MTLFVNVVYSTYFSQILPGPQKEKIKNLSCCHWNVSSLIVHNLSMTSQLEVYHSVYKHDFICIFETFFDSSVQEGDKNIQLDGYNFLRVDHPSNSKRGGVCIFYKETVGARMLKSLRFSECIICKASIQNYNGHVGVEYRSPNQDSFQFKNFCRILRNFYVALLLEILYLS